MEIFIVPQFSVSLFSISFIFCSQINKWMRKYQQNQQRRTSPFLYFAADNSEETEDATDHYQLKFGRSEVLHQIILSLFNM